jgi:hypothetical protein
VGGEDEGSSEFLFNESVEYADSFSNKVIRTTEFIANFTLAHNSSLSEDIKLLVPPSSNISGSGNGNYTLSSNATTSLEPQIPDYIRTTSIVFCVVILCLGLIGNIMVNKS